MEPHQFYVLPYSVNPINKSVLQLKKIICIDAINPSDILIPGMTAPCHWGVESGKLVYPSTFGHLNLGLVHRCTCILTKRLNHHKSIRQTPAIATIMFIDTSLFYLTTCVGPHGPSSGESQINKHNSCDCRCLSNRLVVYIYLYIHTQQDATHRNKIKSPLFATISYHVFIVHVSYYMFRLYISHVVWHVYNKNTVRDSCEQRWFNLFVNIWTCSNLRLHELQAKWVVRSQAAEEAVRVCGILLMEKWVTRICSSG
jgi:hypothetical protein